MRSARLPRSCARAGVRHALVSAGASSIVAVGGRGGGWTIDLRSRQAPDAPLARLRLRDGAMATSGAAEQFVEIDGRRYGHVIDPRTGWPASGLLSVTVITADAADADALVHRVLRSGASISHAAIASAIPRRSSCSPPTCRNTRPRTLSGGATRTHLRLSWRPRESHARTTGGWTPQLSQGGRRRAGACRPRRRGGARGPVRGGPVRVGFIGLGGEGRVLLAQTDPAFAEVRALCDINPAQLTKADEVLAKTSRPPARHYAEWQDMLAKEDLEAVVIAMPLWAHADVTSGCLDAGKHVLCEKMMAWDVAGLRAHARGRGQEQPRPRDRLSAQLQPDLSGGLRGRRPRGRARRRLHGAHRLAPQRQLAPRRASRLRPTTIRRSGAIPTGNTSSTGASTSKYSRGLLAELASHQVNITNWFFGATPEAVIGTGGIYRYADGKREVCDHLYVTFEYPGGRTAVFSSIESNAFDNYYEAFFGTKGTLILQGEAEAYLFDEAGARAATGIEVSPRGAGPALEASESRVADAAGRSATATGERADRLAAYKAEISGFCAAIRVGRPLSVRPRSRHSFGRGLHPRRRSRAAEDAPPRAPGLDDVDVTGLDAQS